MKALSLLQPWATLVVIGAKTIETRKWRTAYRGELLIHASKGKRGARLAGEAPFTKYIPDFAKLPFGAIIGKVILEDIQPVNEIDLCTSNLARLTLEEKAFGDYTPGRFGWIFSEPVLFDKPVPARGSLMLWEWGDE